MDKKYKVAAYMRLSQEDGDKDVSDSIISQKNIIENKIKELGKEFELVEYYIDDGYTGLNLNRPAFQKMMLDQKNGKINTIITKDLSRLSRNSFEANYLIELYFLENGVRYISILDGVDTSVNTSNNDMIQFKTLINDWYSKDISRKIKSSIWARKEKGMYIASMAPYGYKKDEINKHKLIINEKEAEIVKKIFENYNEGKSINEIKKDLRENKILRPDSKEYQLNNEKYEWSEETIRRILSNKVYLGHTEYGKRINLSYKSKKVKYMPKAEWKIIYNTHEPIITKSLFLNVEQRRKKESKIKKRKYDWNLNGLVFCKECQKKMFLKVAIKNNEIKSKKIYCLNGTKNKCVRKSKGINEEDLEEIIKKEIKIYIESIINKKDLINKVKWRLKNRSSFYNIKNTYKDELRKIEKEIKILYEDYKKELLTQEDYIEFYRDKENQRKEIKRKIIRIEKKDIEKEVTDEKIIEQYGKNIYNKSFINHIVEKIKIDKENKIFIYYKYLES